MATPSTIHVSGHNCYNPFDVCLAEKILWAGLAVVAKARCFFFCFFLLRKCSFLHKKVTKLQLLDTFMVAKEMPGLTIILENFFFFFFGCQIVARNSAEVVGSKGLRHFAAFGKARIRIGTDRGSGLMNFARTYPLLVTPLQSRCYPPPLGNITPH